MEKLTHQPILNITKDNQTLSFSDFDSFKPRVAPSAEAKKIPAITQEMFEKSDKSDILTYQNTISVPDWQSQTYEIIQHYLNEINPGILSEMTYSSPQSNEVSSPKVKSVVCEFVCTQFDLVF